MQIQFSMNMLVIGGLAVLLLFWRGAREAAKFGLIVLLMAAVGYLLIRGALSHRVSSFTINTYSDVR